MRSTCHVRNVCEGLLLAAQRCACFLCVYVCICVCVSCSPKSSGQIYFVTDGPPQHFRTFLTRGIATQGNFVLKGGNLPYWAIFCIALLCEIIWAVLGLCLMKSPPPITRQVLCFVPFCVDSLSSRAQGVVVLFRHFTVNDGKARRELGYKGKITIDEGSAMCRCQSLIRLV